MLIALLGDVMLGRLVNRHLAAARPAYPWGDTLAVLEQADVRIANLECVLAAGGEPEPGKIFHFRSDPKNVASLLAAGIDVVSLANNHVLDFGQDAFGEMLPALDGCGILHAGAGPDLEAARRPAVWRVGAVAVGFIAFTDNEPGWEAGTAAPGVYYVPVEGSCRFRDRRPRAAGAAPGTAGRTLGTGRQDQGPRPGPHRVSPLGRQLGLRRPGRAPGPCPGPHRGRGRRRVRPLAAHISRRRHPPEPSHHLQRRGLH